MRASHFQEKSVPQGCPVVYPRVTREGVWTLQQLLSWKGAKARDNRCDMSSAYLLQATAWNFRLKIICRFSFLWGCLANAYVREFYVLPQKRECSYTAYHKLQTGICCQGGVMGVSTQCWSFRTRRGALRMCGCKHVGRPGHHFCLTMTVNRGGTVHIAGSGKLFKMSTIAKYFIFVYSGKRIWGAPLCLLTIKVENG